MNLRYFRIEEKNVDKCRASREILLCLDLNLYKDNLFPLKICFRDKGRSCLFGNHCSRSQPTVLKGFLKLKTLILDL